MTGKAPAMLPSSLLSPLGQTKIYLYAKPADMRKSFDGLHAIVQSEFRRDIRCGDVFLFLNRRLPDGRVPEQRRQGQPLKFNFRTTAARRQGQPLKFDFRSTAASGCPTSCWPSRTLRWIVLTAAEPRPRIIRLDFRKLQSVPSAHLHF
jgi:hypothetical protein